MKNLFKLITLVVFVNMSSFATDVSISADTGTFDGNSYAGTSTVTTLKKYEITINKLEFYNSTLGSWVIVSETPATVDITNAAAGAATAGSMTGAMTLKYGTYTQWRTTVDSTMTLQACGIGADTTTTICTNTSNGTISGAPVTSSAYAAGDVTFTIPSAGRVATGNFTSSFTITADTSSISTDVKFNLANNATSGYEGATMHYATGATTGYIVPAQPSCTVTITVQ